MGVARPYIRLPAAATARTLAGWREGEPREVKTSLSRDCSSGRGAGGRNGGRERGREGWREGGREGGREGRKEGGRERGGGGREGGREGGRDGHMCLCWVLVM